MTSTPLNVLFLCTHNSARSIIAESILNRLGNGRFKGYSAGSQPSGRVHPYALDLVRQLNYDTTSLRSKSWEEFAAPDAPRLDFVFTVCDNAANEVCPVWPGQPVSAHWGVPDPSAAEDTESERRFAFADTHRMLYSASASSPRCRWPRWTGSRCSSGSTRSEATARHPRNRLSESGRLSPTEAHRRSPRHRAPSDDRRRFGDHGRSPGGR